MPKLFKALGNWVRAKDEEAAKAMSDPVRDSRFAIDDSKKQIGEFTGKIASLIAENNRYRVGAFHNAPGFGVIEIDWDREDPLLTLQARDMENEVRLRFEVSLSSLQPNKDLEE